MEFFIKFRNKIFFFKVRKVVASCLIFSFVATSCYLNFFPLIEQRLMKVEDAQAAGGPVAGLFSPERIWTAAANVDLNLRYPDPRANDLLIAAIAIRPSASTVNTPSGWTALGSWTGTDSGAEGVDTGSVGLYWFYKLADGTEGTSTQTFTENGTTSVWTGSIIQARSATGTYSVAAGGYSINGDATNWGGTLDTDIGLTEGDLVVVAAAQNGDPSAASGWGVSATGITDISTINEHGEFPSTTGNDVEVDLGSGIVWGGTNTATPSVALTQSVAASGAVAAVRIRQGSGTNRTDTWVRSAGPQMGGTTSVSFPYPDHEIGDLLIMYVGCRSTADVVPVTPANWTYLGTYNGGAGTFGVDAGNARIAVYYREANSFFTGNQAITVTGGNTAVGQILAIHRESVGYWSIDIDGGTDNTAGTAWSATGSGIDLSSSDGGDVVLVGSSINADTYLYSSHALSASGITFGDVTQTSEYRYSGGNDMTMEVVTGRVSSGSATNVAPTFSSTASGSTASAPAGASAFVKIKGNNATFSDPVVGMFTPPAAWTAAGDANLNLRHPDPRANDLLVATIAIRPSSSTVNTPSGWTSLGSWSGTDGGAEGVSTGSVSVYWFYKVSDGSEGISNQTFTENGTTSVWTGSIMQVRSATGTYSVSAGGYSINGDATNWGGALDTDIGLTQGDLVLVSAAQNGNLSASSGWGVSAAGISSISTINEHGEFASTTGNDMEVDFGSGIVWEGTNTVTPDVSLSQSVATSGAVTAVRIRQGSGTNRTDTWVRSAGPQAGGTTSVLVPYPDHEIGDLLVLFVGCRSTADVTPATPKGWTYLGTYNGGVGTFAADAGNSRITIFYQEPEFRLEEVLPVAITGGNTAIGQIVSVHRDDVAGWSTDIDGGTDASAGTAWSVTGTGIDLSGSDGGDVVLVGSSVNTDAYLYSAHTLSASGITFGDVTQTAEYRYSGGNDMTLEVATGRVASGSATNVAPTFSSTASGSTASAPAGSSAFVKLYASTSTATVISVSVDDGSVAYGEVPLNSEKDTTVSGVNNTQIATNDGNVTEDFNIKTSHATGGTQWSVGAAAGANTYVHSFSINSGSSWEVLQTVDTYETLATAISASGTEDFDLKIGTPTSTADYIQKSITVTVQAVEN